MMMKMAILFSMPVPLKNDHVNSYNNDDDDKENDTMTMMKMTILFAMPVPLNAIVLILITTMMMIKKTT